jgi:RNA polymerase sigma factor (sigma-70 family)
MHQSNPDLPEHESSELRVSQENTLSPVVTYEPRYEPPNEDNPEPEESEKPSEAKPDDSWKKEMRKTLKRRSSGNLPDPHEFEEKWRKIENEIVAFFYRNGVKEQDVTELTQQTAIRAYYGLYPGIKDFNKWVKGIAKYLWYKHLRQAIRNRGISSIYDLEINDIEDMSNEYDEFAEIIEDLPVDRFKERMLNKFKDKRRRIMELHYKGVSVKEISKITGIGQSTVYDNIDKAEKLALATVCGY